MFLGVLGVDVVEQNVSIGGSSSPINRTIIDKR
jgi:hypothetical protein